MQQQFSLNTSGSLEDLTAAKLAASTSLQGKKNLPAAASVQVGTVGVLPGNSPADGAEVIGTGLKTARRRWLEPPPTSVVVTEAGQTRLCMEDVSSMPVGSLSGQAPSQQGELVAEIRWLLVCREGVCSVEKKPEQDTHYMYIIYIGCHCKLHYLLRGSLLLCCSNYDF